MHRTLGSSFWILLISCLLILLSALCSDATHVLDAYRLFQMEKGGARLGCDKSAVNLQIIGVNSTTNQALLEEYVVIIPFAQFTIDLLDQLLAKRVGAVVIVLPKDYHETSSSTSSRGEQETLTRWRTYEQKLLQMHLKGAALYFTFEDDYLAQMCSESLVSSKETQWWNLDQKQLIISNEGNPVPQTAASNFQGSLSGLNDKEQVPTILLVAYYDTFAVAPGLGYGADSSASGAVALLELARVFSKLYSNSKTQGRFNLMFLLTGAGRFNFAGSKHWLGNAETRLLDSIDFVLCLDTIGRGEKLFLHVYRLPKDETVQKVYESFQSTAKRMNIPFEIIQKKIDMTAPEVDWEHEHYAFKKLLSMTLSHEPAPLPLLSRSHIFDTKSQVSLDILERNTRFVGEALAHHIYGGQGEGIFRGSLSISRPFLDSWMTVLSSSPRVTPFLAGKKDPILLGVESVLREYTSNTINQTFSPETDITFYDGNVTTMSVFRVKPFLFDMILSLIIGSYLLVLYAVLKGPTEFWKQIKRAILGGDKKQKKK